MNEHEIEPVNGLPEALPNGETMLWQGAPVWQQLAIRVFHVRKIAVYFLLLIGAHIAFGVADGATLSKILTGSAWLALLGAVSIAILGTLAWFYGKTTLYTITDQRLVMRIGVVLTMAINIPWNKLDAADLTLRGNIGDITLTLAGTENMSYWLLWPHAKPWHFSRVQPMLRCLGDAEYVAAQLSQVFQQRTRVNEASTSRGSSTAANAVYTGAGTGPSAAMS